MGTTLTGSNASRNDGHYQHQWQRDFSYEQREAAPQPFNFGRAIVIVLIIALVIAALIGIGAAIVIPNIQGARDDAMRVADADNLQGLMKSWVAGLADMKRSPANVGVSEGSQFWIALYTTDGGETPSDYFIEPYDASLLVSPADPYFADAAAIEDIADALTAATEPAVMINGKTVSSYNGPTIATMRAVSTLSGKIIGCTGDRDGMPIFDDGTNLLYGSIKVEFATWADCAMIAGTDAMPEYPSVQNAVLTLALPFAFDTVHYVD